MDLGLWLGSNGHSAAEEQREFITLGVSNRTNTIELLSSTWNVPAPVLYLLQGHSSRKLAS